MIGLYFFALIERGVGVSARNRIIYLVRTSFDCHSACLSKLISNAAISWNEKKKCSLYIRIFVDITFFRDDCFIAIFFVRWRLLIISVAYKYASIGHKYLVSSVACVRYLLFGLKAISLARRKKSTISFRPKLPMLKTKYVHIAFIAHNTQTLYPVLVYTAFFLFAALFLSFFLFI